jgi:hypothetical protein
LAFGKVDDSWERRLQIAEEPLALIVSLLTNGHLKMISNKKIMNMKVVRLIEISDFIFWIITIRVNIRLQEAKYQILNY